MEWIASLITLLFLVLIIVMYLTEKDTFQGKNAILLVLFSFVIYHIGDTGLWYGYNYELVRRVASIGFYLEIPFMLLLLYYIIPKEKRSNLMRILTLILMLPWLAAIILVYEYPLVFLEKMGGSESEELMYVWVLCFILAIVFMSVYGYKAARFHEGGRLKKLAKAFATANIVLLVLYLILWSTMDAFGYDATWLFGVATITWVVFVRKATCPRFNKE